jgi:hypothetical protein
MNRIRRYILPVVAGTSLILGMAVAMPTVASAKGKVPKPASIKVSPKTVANAGGNVTVTGKNFTAAYADQATNPVEVVICIVGASGANNCDTSDPNLIVQATVSSTGTFTVSFPVPGGSNLATGYQDTAGDQCGSTTANEKACGIGAGTANESVYAAPVAIKIKPPKK